MAEPGAERVDGRRVVPLIFAGWLPQDGLFGGSGTAGLATSVAPEGAAHSAVADSLLTLPSPGSCSSKDVGGPMVLAQWRCSGSGARVNVEHAQRSEHERR